MRDSASQSGWQALNNHKDTLHISVCSTLSSLFLIAREQRTLMTTASGHWSVQLVGQRSVMARWISLALLIVLSICARTLCGRCRAVNFAFPLLCGISAIHLFGTFICLPRPSRIFASLSFLLAGYALSQETDKLHLRVTQCWALSLIALLISFVFSHTNSFPRPAGSWLCSAFHYYEKKIIQNRNSKKKQKTDISHRIRNSDKTQKLNRPSIAVCS